MSRKIPNASEMGKKGGEKLKAIKPPEYWREIGMKGNEAMKEKFKDTDFFKERSRKAILAKQKKRKMRNSSLEKVASLLRGS